MNVNGQNFQTIWADPNNPARIYVIDQQKLPFAFTIKTLRTFDDARKAIADMLVRGAPLIGITAVYGLYLGMLQEKNRKDLFHFLEERCLEMKATRPTAVNLAHAVDAFFRAIKDEKDPSSRIRKAFETAEKMRRDEVACSRAIGEKGLPLIEEIAARKKGEAVNILTHCNAGWLACIDWGTALAPVYCAQRKGIPVHVWVDETRPRNQGSRLTAFELQQESVPFTVIPDNTGGHLMQHGKVDLVLVGSDRTTCTGDVCNKIGTYLKALAAHDNGIPFYAAMPSSSIDFTLTDGLKEIPIEERSPEEIIFLEGKNGTVQVVPDHCPVANYGFDVTPARLVTGLITERGICKAHPASLSEMFPER
ncbi:MAG TPA: S-methyl-5-thioribose-1-phosphate isomerase [Prolixibacteraceae bacterium]|nr:S-methyl-5-thioribose-1-phosphate isomerase [Prolixibacteraceae bacterium]